MTSVSVERAEAAFWASFLRNRNLDVTTVDDGAVSVAGGYAVYATGTFLQYAIGAGTTRSLRADDLAIVEEFYAERGAPSRLELTDAAIARDRALLDARGYADDGLTLAVLEAPLPLAGEPSTAVGTRVVGDRRAWSALSLRAFADTVAGDDAAETLRRSTLLSAAAASALVVATLDGVDVGAAAVRLVDDVALLYAAAVLPEARGHGVHGALLAARTAFARTRGATRAALKTAAGEPAERSALRHGFARTALLRHVTRAR
ncbi:MAG TPA: GNAT family N-acetyltransferase [Candidatus Sulfotelmatobacter sp.]|nr:GNAT family N-acetyltransferase [Candidatus Sulfotelmatobacter sp.]